MPNQWEATATKIRVHHLTATRPHRGAPWRNNGAELLPIRREFENFILSSGGNAERLPIHHFALSPYAALRLFVESFPAQIQMQKQRITFAYYCNKWWSVTIDPQARQAFGAIGYREGKGFIRLHVTP